MVKFKDGVILKAFSLWTLHLMEALLKIEGYTPTITSGNDGKHMDGSLHYKNLAYDIRDFDNPNPKAYAETLQKTLGPSYQVLLEKDHIHVEASDDYLHAIGLK